MAGAGAVRRGAGSGFAVLTAERKPYGCESHFKIAAIGIVVSVLNQVLARSGREEQATMTTLAGLVVVLMMVVRQISDLFDLVRDLFGL